MDEQGRLSPQAKSARWSSVARTSPQATKTTRRPTAKLSSSGWFRTGDQGVIDAEGYLTLTGRLKEIINRGGEKISPREVDEALMDHPAVLQAVAFALPHPMLGEDVGAAVVLRDGLTATEQDLHAFLVERLAAFKTPRKILFLAEIPKGRDGEIAAHRPRAEARTRVSETGPRGGRLQPAREFQAKRTKEKESERKRKGFLFLSFTFRNRDFSKGYGGKK